MITLKWTRWLWQGPSFQAASFLVKWNYYRKHYHNDFSRNQSRRRCWRRRWEAVRKRSGESSGCVCCGNTVELFPYMSMGEVEERRVEERRVEGCWRACVTPGSVRRLRLWMENRLKSRDRTQSGWIGERTVTEWTSKQITNWPHSVSTYLFIVHHV